MTRAESDAVEAASLGFTQVSCFVALIRSAIEDSTLPAPPAVIDALGGVEDFARYHGDLLNKLIH